MPLSGWLIEAVAGLEGDLPIAFGRDRQRPFKDETVFSTRMMMLRSTRLPRSFDESHDRLEIACAGYDTSMQLGVSADSGRGLSAGD